MKCSKCKQECVGIDTGDVEEDVCEDCGFPTLFEAGEYAFKYMKEEYFKRTGKKWISGWIQCDVDIK